MPPRIAAASVVAVAIAAISVVGEALPPPGDPQAPSSVLEVTPSSILFGYQAYGTRSPARDVTVRSVNGPTDITLIRLSGTAASSFEIIAGGEPGTLPENQIRTIKLAFAPKQWRPGHEARLHIQSGQHGPTVRLWGPAEAQPSVYAIEPTGSPPRLEFGWVKLQVTSPIKTVTFRNIGPSSYQASATELGPWGLPSFHPQDFRVVHNSCIRPVAPSATCVVGFTFRPTGLDARIADFKLTRGAATKVVRLRGSGAAH